MRAILFLFILLITIGCTSTKRAQKDSHQKELDQKIVKKIQKPKPIPYPVNTTPLFKTERDFKRRPLPKIALGHFKQLLPVTLPKDLKLTQKFLYELFTTLDTPYGTKAPNFRLENGDLYIMAFSPFMDRNKTTRHYARLQLEIAATIAFQRLKKTADQFQKPIYIPFLTTNGEIWICGIWRGNQAITHFYKKNHKLTDYYPHLSLQYSNVYIAPSDQTGTLLRID